MVNYHPLSGSQSFLDKSDLLLEQLNPQLVLRPCVSVWVGRCWEVWCVWVEVWLVCVCVWGGCVYVCVGVCVYTGVWCVCVGVGIMRYVCVCVGKGCGE